MGRQRGGEGFCPCYGAKATAEGKGLKDHIRLSEFSLSPAVIRVRSYEEFTSTLSVLLPPLITRFVMHFNDLIICYIKFEIFLQEQQ